MGSEFLLQLVEGTADAAFAVDENGLISAWNAAAQELFGLNSGQAIGQSCHEILSGADEAGAYCAQNCSVQRALKAKQALPNFDMEVRTKDRRQWCNFTIDRVIDPASGAVHALHLARPLEVAKLLEQLVHVLASGEQRQDSKAAAALISSGVMTVKKVELTARENEILQLLASGAGTVEIAGKLYISPFTVKNHVQHLLEKLDSRNRLEVVIRAREAGLI